MSFPVNPADGFVYKLGNKYFIYNQESGWVQQEPTGYFVQNTKPTISIEPSRVAVWHNPLEGVIYLWQDGDWKSYFTICS